MADMKKKFKTFLSDGVSERDFLLVLSAGVFFLFVSVALVMTLFQVEIDSMYISLLNMVSEVMMTIVISVFGLGGVEKVTTYLGNKEEKRNHSNINDTENRYESRDDII